MINKNNIVNHLKNKKILMMGLGLLGRGIGIAKFLANQDAKLTITDLKTAEQLKSSLRQLEKFPDIKYVLGRHRLADFKNKDMIIRAANVPLDSLFLKEAAKNKIPVEMDASLFAKLSPAKIIGITGTRGKSTVTKLIYDCLKNNYKKGSIYLGGNIRGLATLPLIEKTKENDLVVLELDSWQLQGFSEQKISPAIAVFTVFFNDHQNYYKNDMNRYFLDKANIFKNQKEKEFLIISEQAKKEISKRYKGKIRSQKIIAKPPAAKWPGLLLGKHNQLNISLAWEAVKILGISKNQFLRFLKTVQPEPGRLELIKQKDGIAYYNDTNSTTPEACLAALDTLTINNKKNIILLAGGADKNLDFKKMATAIKKKVKFLILFKGAATEKIIKELGSGYKNFTIVDSMKKAFVLAQSRAKKGAIILLSPGAASFGVFKNEYDRGDRFNKLTKRI